MTIAIAAHDQAGTQAVAGARSMAFASALQPTSSLTAKGRDFAPGVQLRTDVAGEQRADLDGRAEKLRANPFP